MKNLENGSKNVELWPYTKDNLGKALSNSDNPNFSLEKSKILDYFHGYLFEINDSNRGNLPQCCTIIIEKEYTSASFLADYYNYYSHTFQSATKFCSRIHFVSKFISSINDFTKILEEEVDFFDKHYLGHIVLKNIPHFCIGASLLKPFAETDTRKYPAIRDYKISLFGREHKLRTLVFTEPDVISVCATTSLWVTLHKLSRLYDLALLAPSEITQLATMSNRNPALYEKFPTEGLNTFQISQVLRKLKLNIEVQQVQSIKKNNDFDVDDYVRSFIYSFLRSEVPVLLGMSRGSKTETKTKNGLSVIEYAKEGEMHLTAAVGFSVLPLPLTHHVTKNNFYTKASGMDKLFVHDDSVGPFSKIEIKEQLFLGYNNDERHAYKIENLIVGIDKTIRITHNIVYQQATLFYQLLSESEWKGKFITDIYLSASNDYKKNILHFSNESLKENIIYTPLPKNVWLINITDLEENTLMDIVIDSTALPIVDEKTDILRGKPCLSINIWNESLREFIGKIDIEKLTEYIGEHYVERIGKNF